MLGGGLPIEIGGEVVVRDPVLREVPGLIWMMPVRKQD